MNIKKSINIYKKPTTFNTTSNFNNKSIDYVNRYWKKEEGERWGGGGDEEGDVVWCCPQASREAVHNNCVCIF